MAELQEKISRSASAVARAIKDHPIPVLLIGAGVAWAIYSSRKRSEALSGEDERYRSGPGYDPDLSYDEPLEYPTPSSERRFGAPEVGFTFEDPPTDASDGISGESNSNR